MQWVRETILNKAKLLIASGPGRKRPKHLIRVSDIYIFIYDDDHPGHMSQRHGNEPCLLAQPFKIFSQLDDHRSGPRVGKYFDHLRNNSLQLLVHPSPCEGTAAAGSA